MTFCFTEKTSLFLAIVIKGLIVIRKEFEIDEFPNIVKNGGCPQFIKGQMRVETLGQMLRADGYIVGMKPELVELAGVFDRQCIYY